MTKRLLIVALVLAAVGGAYALGRQSASAPTGPTPATTPASPMIVEGLSVPTGLSVPATPPALPIVEEPAKLLQGEVKIPLNLLQNPMSAPPPPSFVMPDLPAGK
ncbi:MAG: hypothetical protein ACRCZF_01080 [Gemmataceae bacterium]